MLCALVAGSLAGCSAEPVQVPNRTLAGADARACRALLADLPGSIGERERVEVTPDDAYAAAWGDPPIVLSCGVGVPEEFSRTAACQEADGVGWFVPDPVLEDESLDVTLTAVGFRPRVELVVPGEERPEGVAAAMTSLAKPVREHLDEVRPCL